MLRRSLSSFYTAHTNPALNGRSEIQHLERGDVIEIRNGIIFPGTASMSLYAPYITVLTIECTRFPRCLFSLSSKASDSLSTDLLAG